MSAFPACLVVDDETDIRELLVLTLERMDIRADSASSLSEAMHLLKKGQYGLCLTDMRLPDGSGLDLVNRIAQDYPGLPVAVITAYGSAENAVSALKAGAFDYLTKPISLKQLRPLVQSALKLSAADKANASEDTGALKLIGNSPAIQHVRSMIEKLSRSQAPVYISGESGSGKELAARLIHQHSSRRDGPFIAVNCGAIPENLMESEFFGHKKGAFTGAIQDKEGMFHAAKGGTLFLDEVADLPLAMQVKLLRAIQEKKVRMVGGTQEESVDVRIISATHKNLSVLMERGEFRQDLYYRLNVIELKLPALRDMPEDIPMLVDALLAKQCREQNRPIPTLSPEASHMLARHSFPGNVRELENVLERALALCDGNTITVDDLLLDQDASAHAPSARSAPEDEGLPLPDYLEHIEKTAILNALEKTQHNKTAAAKLLGVSFRTFRYRLSKLGLSKDTD
ncbi:sigma-54-dependent transcriptional regulator [Methylobacillus flagellatus]|uniref:Two component, sigma54 specific, transcriptional regulator, Fis family n=1 Tax=Methylobacillus flagellatus (strain ATCC 51484 / DSM 6875 / VKM B-1610 / KT) TaxID=265072 RepID=Q1H4V2_METFK|nr:sigma-54 dependent transcriptional regulator [Methylobacillus flagellatus]ABE48485.1 two component, sigma54 specific, transcriptional regulator, Fis family [Methylobacillus flagellatus KT]